VAPGLRSTSGNSAQRTVQAARDYRFHWRAASIVFLLALGYRGLYLYEASQRPTFNIFYLDQEYHLRWAKGLAFDQWYPPYDGLRDSPYFRAPLYP
jgi:hypothetical protein